MNNNVFTTVKMSQNAAKLDRDDADTEKLKKMGLLYSTKSMSVNSATTSSSDWDKSMRQGTVGFRAYVEAKMRDAGLVFEKRHLVCPMAPPRTCVKTLAKPKKTAGGGKSCDNVSTTKFVAKNTCNAPKADQFPAAPFQQVVQFLVRPTTTVDRLLIAHRTGLGKTYAMILILDNFYSDPRPKVVVFPNAKVKKNFYMEMMKFPNRYRNFVLEQTGIKCLTGDVQELCLIESTLALKGRLGKAGSEGFPGGPMRAYTYTGLGRAAIERMEDPMFKFGKPEGHKGKPFDYTLILMDEFHNLIAPEPDVLQYPSAQRNLNRTSAWIQAAQESVIVGLTATPVINDPEDARRILDVIKGNKYKDATDEGFVSFFQDLPKEVFASVTPGPPPGVFPTLREFELTGENLQVYNCVESRLLDLDEQPKCPKGYTLPTVTKALQPDSAELYNRLHHLSTMSRTYKSPMTKGYAFPSLIEQDPQSAATKLYHVVSDIIKYPVKTLVMLHRESGFKALQLMWETVSKSREYPCDKACWMSLYDPQPDDEAKLNLFNCEDNKDGQLVRVMFVDAKMYEAGVSFLGVRRLIMVDVPKRWSSWMQRIGRALRFCGHENLPRNERKVELIMYVARRPSGRKTSDEYFVEDLKRQNAEMMKALDYLRDTAAVDTNMYRAFEAPKMFVRGFRIFDYLGNPMKATDFMDTRSD